MFINYVIIIFYSTVVPMVWLAQSWLFAVGTNLGKIVNY